MEIYDREGRPQNMAWFNEKCADMEYKRVLETQIGPYWVSTVWLGLDHSFSDDGPPLIFETMVFATDSRDPERDTLGPDLDCLRWSTEQEAIKGHQDMCTLVRATYQGELDYEGSEESNGSEM